MYRGDCPACGGENSFTATKDMGKLRYNCFRASCDLGGVIKGEMSVTDITKYLLDNVSPMFDIPDDRRNFVVPDYFVSGNRTEVLRYLSKNNVLEAYEQGRVDIRYDPRQNRCVFLIKDENNVVGAVGRALSSSVKPKWHIYHSEYSACLYIRAGDSRSRNVILVEDAASACSASRVYDSISLLGTTLHDSYLKSIQTYPTIYIALDKDASSKAIDMHRELSYICNDVKVVLLEHDLKYASKEEICQLLSC